MAKKIAVVLFNLGGPSSQEAVKPFLFNLFSDPAIIRLPKIFRNFLARKISTKREEEAKGIYRQIGGNSPILQLTMEQAAALESELGANELGAEYKIFIAMRYWHPFAHETVQDVKEYSPDEIILLPLYPQFSTTTTGSSVNNWKEAAKKEGLDAPTRTICCYPTDGRFIDAHVGLIKKYYDDANKISEPRILFSAHGLPEKIVKSGDPYQWQVEKTVGAIVDRLAITVLDFQICYQSRVGPLKWIGPSTGDEVIRVANDDKPVVVVPIAFVSEHSETLVELDIQYKKLAEENGLKNYFRVPALATNEIFIKSLAGICHDAIKRPAGSCSSHLGEKICPKQRSGCISKG